MFRFHTQRIISVLIYISSIIYSLHFSLVPIIQYHGGWTFIYTTLGLFTLGFLSTITFLTAKRPAATYRPFSTNKDLS